MRPIVWSRRAARNLTAIRRYIDQFDPDAATGIAKRILQSVKTISEHPQIGHAGRDARTREFLVAGTPYLIVYTLRDTTLEIVAVLHGAQIIEPEA